MTYYFTVKFAYICIIYRKGINIPENEANVTMVTFASFSGILMPFLYIMQIYANFTVK